jgi:hypothetical protein
MKSIFDLAIAWNWEYDRDFVSMLEGAARSAGLWSYAIAPENLPASLLQLRDGSLEFRAFLDRASDDDERFLPLAQALRLSPAVQLNSHEAIRHAADKATMHLEFMTHGIDVPYTIIISPYSEQQQVGLTLGDLSHLGRPFIIKPANTTGGGIGVITGAETLKDVIDSRQHHKDDKYLLQEKIHPEQLNGKVGWFRVFRIYQSVLACWWHPESHLYEEISQAEFEQFRLGALDRAAEKIQEVCNLDFFSTEIAAVSGGRFVVVDYVNEICDMRIQSRHPDGVPDRIVTKICEIIAGNLKRLLTQ